MQHLFDYCDNWRFKNIQLPQIQAIVDNYLLHILNKTKKYIIVDITTTRICLREPHDDNYQNGLDIQIEWFDHLKKFEDIINPVSWFTWFINILLFSGNKRIFDKQNFYAFYAYFEYRKKSQQHLALAETYIDEYLAIKGLTNYTIHQISNSNIISFMDYSKRDVINVSLRSVVEVMNKIYFLKIKAEK